MRVDFWKCQHLARFDPVIALLKSCSGREDASIIHPRRFHVHLDVLRVTTSAFPPGHPSRNGNF